MKAASIILLILTHHGLWFGGQENSVTVRPVVQEGWPEAVVKWELGLGALKIADGTALLAAGGGEGGNEVTISIKLPEVRAHSAMTLSCHVFRKDDGRELGTQEAAIDVFPPVDCGGLSERFAKKKLLVIDRPESIPAFLKHVGIPCTAGAARDNLLAPLQDAIVVGEQQLDDSPMVAKALLGQAEAGASVLILRQLRGPVLELPIAGRRPPGSYKLEPDHPLLDGLTPAQWQAAIAEGKPGVPAIQLPADAPALAVVAFPQELPSAEPGPIDALLVVQATGKGRIVYSQLPLTDFDHDPAAGIFLRNALAYLLTRPEPTPPLSERPATQPKAEPKIPTLHIEGG